MKNYTILIVDDDPHVAEQIIYILEKNNPNYLFFKTVSAKLACQIAEQKQPDIIITDWQMPDMNGIELTNCLQHNYKTKNIPIIIASGIMTTSENLQTALNSGAIDFIRKPIDEIELTARTRSAIKLMDYHKALIEQKEREISLHAMYAVQSSEADIKIAKQLQSILAHLENTPNEVKELILSIIHDMKMRKNKQSWEYFESYFHKSFPDFVKRLTELHPNLTQYEIKLCVFFRMNLETKDIATLLSVKSESIITSRKRLRKKLNRQIGDSLFNYLTSI
ncbi:MAG TPA: hypothetical protein DCQ31_14865 [Bacteroidales bacterium]|nr:hypothetical protein [Bacteroidales bacterium]